MSEAIEAGLSEVIRFAERLDTPFKGASYLTSREKRLMDSCGSRILRMITAPIVRSACKAVYEEDGGPTIIELRRVGKDGVIFGQRKIRSMALGNERLDGLPAPKSSNDPRITKVGKRIRAKSIDELPQLENVIRGEMSLIGPRPKAIQEFAYYSRQNPKFGPGYTSCLPGMTGLAQISGRALVPDAERMRLEIEYAETTSLGMDIDILRRTLHEVRTQRGAF